VRKPKTNDENAQSASPIVQVKITPPNIQHAAFKLLGLGPMAVNRFSEKAQRGMEETQRAGKTSQSKKKREPKQFEELFEAARYQAAEGWDGIHAAALRNAMISACSIVDFKMTRAKKGIFIKPEGFDAQDGTPLIRIWGPPPVMWIAPVRNADGSFDLRPRPRWDEWELHPHIEYDADMFTLSDITNLVMRVGFQVGLGEGRPDSKRSAGIDYGHFRIDSESDRKGDKAA